MQLSAQGFKPFELVALTLPGRSDPSVAIAASRAGGIGLLDLQYARDESEALAAVERLIRHAVAGRCGLKLDPASQTLVARLTSAWPRELGCVLLPAADCVGLEPLVQSLRSSGLTILLEATSLEEARRAEALGADAIVAKGHEASGRVGEETTFILLQRLLVQVSLPVLAHGGIGQHSAAAAYEAGAAGVVLDAQFALTRESSLPEAVRSGIERMDGSETIILGAQLGEAYRVYHRPGLSVNEELRRMADSLLEQRASKEERIEAWRREIRARVGACDDEGRSLLLLGQDAAFAAPLAKSFRTVGGVLEAVRQSIDEHLRAAQRLKPLDQDSPLARSHGTRYPLVQGPMTRVSDRASFAAEVAAGGGLPFLALALMRAPEVESLLKETQSLLRDKPWGVGILGFVPLDLREEQLEVIRAYKPPFALIAGGRPDQALALEHAGIPTYLHVPSPGLLKLFIESGARRFIFEGRECGGHVGPRASFVLWNMMIDTLLDALPPEEMSLCHVLFAGGIHDALSSSMVATMASTLAERGAKVGALLGTAYLFTKEAVTSGAIVEGFQREAIRCRKTVLLESGPGHSTRCVETPFAEVFEREKRRLGSEGRSAEEVRAALEDLNVGRLRIASKGINRHPGYKQDPQAPRFISVGEEEQRAEGMYMIGQVAALRDRTCTIEELHREVSIEGSRRLSKLVQPNLARVNALKEEKPCDVAIIGMNCLLPKATDWHAYWENILNKVDAITEVPRERFDWRKYFDPDPKTKDKIYSRWGGFLDEVPFDPLRYGMPPNTIPSIEPLQLLTLEVVRAALDDAGYLDRPFPRQRTSVILGAGGGIADLGDQYIVRSALPHLLDEVPPALLRQLPEWTEDSFPGILLNVIAGRVANRFDLGGVNYTVDAACASSLAAIYMATRELEAGTSDMVIAGAGDTVQNYFAFLCFSKTHALSPTGRCRTFDEKADGIAISEGIAVLVLKRLADAERDGDHIYAVIKGIAGSSDGKDKSLTAPRPDGQAVALERAYAKAGFSPNTVELIEAHGTGTVAGDQAEVETLKRVFGAAGTERQRCAIGSVKSMIGHTKCTAGVAGMMKVALALERKVLPPTMNVTQPNAKAQFPESPFYINTELRPWIHQPEEHPRRAGVSAFGFGGTNFHAVLEEYTGDFLASARRTLAQNWTSELLLWTGESRQQLLASLEKLDHALAQGARPRLCDLAAALWREARGRVGLRLALVVTSLEDLRQKLLRAIEALKRGDEKQEIRDARGIYFTEEPLARAGKLAFLFSGQGSQYTDMLRELSTYFEEVREQFELADRVLAGRLPQRLSSYIFPPPSFGQEEEEARQRDLTRTNIAQPALGAASMGLFRLLASLGVRPDMVAGHSYGEYGALCSAGVFGEEDLYAVSEARGRCIIEAAEGSDTGTMAAVSDRLERVAEALQSMDDVWLANINAPRQVVISGTREGVGRAVERLRTLGVEARQIAVACAFHSPVIAEARDRLASVLSALDFKSPRVTVFSNISASAYPSSPDEIAGMLAQHLVSPVRFADEVSEMYAAGARIFVEVGPRNVLTGLTGQILGERPHLALSSDMMGRSGLLHLHHLLGQLAAHGAQLNLDRLYEGRISRRLNLSALLEETMEKPLPRTTWLINGGRARPLHQTIKPEEQAREANEREANGREARAAVKAESINSLSAFGPISSPAPAMQQNGSASSSSPAVSERQESHAPAPPSPEPKMAEHVSQPFMRQAGAPVNGDAEHALMLRFQQMMGRFLETQQQVMLAYLQGQQSADPASQSIQPQASLAHIPTELPAASNPAPATPSQSPAEGLPVKAISADAAPDQSISGPTRDRDEIQHLLLDVVSEKTGYPAEMLQLDANLEADLGIDSIKRVEILGTFQRAFLGSAQQNSSLPMEKLTGIKTLRGIVDALGAGFQQEPKAAAGGPTHSEGRALRTLSSARISEDGESALPRFLLEAMDAPASSQSLQIPTDRVFLVSDDESGAADSFADAIRRRGGRAVTVRLDQENKREDDFTYAAKLTEESGAGWLVETVRREHGPIAGIVHLLPLKPVEELESMSLEDWRSVLDRQVKSLFLLAKAAAADFKGSSAESPCWLVAATSMGGVFASAGAGGEFSPSQGSVGGLIKTLAQELTGVHHRIIDFDGDRLGPALAERLLTEMLSQDEEVEVGYRGARRMVLRAREAFPDQYRAPAFEMGPDSVLLITGGARGITAEVACELAARYRPIILLAGRSPLPQAEEPPETSALTSPRELKAAIMDRMRSEGQSTVTPAMVEAAYSRLLQDREMRRYLASMKQSGATVSYFQTDVRDEKMFDQLISQIYQSYGRIDGVIHGAGIIEDKLFEDKSCDSFARVFETKALSAFILSRSLRPASLKFMAFFSSISGRFGNRGQSDYAAANEVLNKLALYLDRKWPARVVALNWGPWEKTGMASMEVQRQFAERGVQIIGLAAGRRATLDEILYGRKGETEVILGGGPWSGREAYRPFDASEAVALAADASLSTIGGD